MQWSIVSAVNNERTLATCLLKSPGARSATDFFLQRGYPSAAAAYNNALSRVISDLVVFVHQDVYLPEGWFESVKKAIAGLEVQDPAWGVLGVWGVTLSGARAGHVYWTGLPLRQGGVFDDHPVKGAGKLIPEGRNRPFEGALEVTSLDEVVLILRKSSGLRFDESLPGYHLYATDLCLEARRRGRKCYAISAWCIHNTRIGKVLPWQFWRGYLALRRKWNHTLPIATPCTVITRSGWPMLWWNGVRLLNLLRRRHTPAKPLSDPEPIYDAIVSLGLPAATSTGIPGNDLPREAGTPSVAYNGKG